MGLGRGRVACRCPWSLALLPAATAVLWHVVNYKSGQRQASGDGYSQDWGQCSLADLQVQVCEADGVNEGGLSLNRGLEVLLLLKEILGELRK